jgi:peptidoglycan/LPS O-acetylase OafA/YrhL
VKPSTGAPLAAGPSHRIPSLDGLRAVSIAIVLAAHAAETQNLRFEPYSHALYAFGAFGVKVFFVISGFLITTLLLNEERKRGRISLGMFYFRRTFRIWPVAYAFILVIALMSAFGLTQIPKHNLIYALTFTMNHVRNGAWVTGHLWSLAVEEQFYLVWPLVFLLTGYRARVIACMSIVIAAPLLRIGTLIYAPDIYQAMESSLLYLGDAIAIGCLLALLAGQLSKGERAKRFFESRWFFLVPIMAVAMYATLQSSLWPKFHLAIGNTISLLCIAATIWRVICWQDWATRILNSRVFVFVGILSYSLYVWQQIFLDETGRFWINRFPQNLVLAFLAAIFSYYVVETPFLRLRERLSSRLRARRAVLREPESESRPAREPHPVDQVAS